MNSRSSNSTRN